MEWPLWVHFLAFAQAAPPSRPPPQGGRCEAIVDVHHPHPAFGHLLPSREKGDTPASRFTPDVIPGLTRDPFHRLRRGELGPCFRRDDRWWLGRILRPLLSLRPPVMARLVRAIQFADQDGSHRTSGEDGVGWNGVVPRGAFPAIPTATAGAGLGVLQVTLPRRVYGARAVLFSGRGVTPHRR
jgi:hypothetical protein